MNEYAISVRALSRDFRRRTAVDNATFDVRKGRVTGLLGLNGAGKTTTLRMMLGLIAPTRGIATVFGSPYASLVDAPRRVGVSMGDVDATPGASVIGDLRTCATILGVSYRRCDEVLDFVGLEERGKKIDKLSKGMMQRYSLAVALLTLPDLLILDEPANGLDPEGIRWLRDILRAYADSGRTVLLSSHQLAEVEQTVDDVIVLQTSVRFLGTLDELTDGGAVRLEQRFFDLVGAQKHPARHASEATP